jgi:hypothetical protein
MRSERRQSQECAATGEMRRFRAFPSSARNGEVRPKGVVEPRRQAAASDAGNAPGLVFFIFDLLHLDGGDVRALPLIERKAQLAALLSGVAPPLHYSDYHRGQGSAFHDMSRRANWSSRASSRNAPMHPIRRAIAGCGSDMAAPAVQVFFSTDRLANS